MQILPVTVSNVTVSKKGQRLVGPLNLTIDTKGFTVIMGPNGSGKTTLLRTLHGLERPASGTVEWQCDAKAARTYQSFVFQSPIMLRRNVVENLVYPLKLRKTPTASCNRIADVWLDRIKLREKSSLPAHFLSGGERQRLALARALVTKPQILFLDEPTANLDGGSTKEIEGLLQEASQNGLRIVMTTHDVAQARRLAEEVVFLYNGEIIETGSTDRVLENPRSAKVQSFVRGDIVE